MTRVVFALVVALALAPTALAARGQSPGTPPPRADLKSLAGVMVGDTAKRVTELWGRNYKVCPSSFCRHRTWIYLYPKGKPLGAGVRFKNGRVVSIFTLGTAPGFSKR